jgi:hypothetical protein
MYDIPSKRIFLFEQRGVESGTIDAPKPSMQAAEIAFHRERKENHLIWQDMRHRQCASLVNRCNQTFYQKIFQNDGTEN